MLTISKYTAGAIATITSIGGLMCMNTVRAGTTGIRTRFDKVSSVLKPGLCLTIPGIHELHEIENRVQTYPFEATVKTKDNVFASVSVAVQYQIPHEKSEKVFLTLVDPEQQLGTFVHSALRAEVPKWTLDGLFSSHREITMAVDRQLRDKLDTFGVELVATLLDEIKPDKKVMEAMNAINASERLRVAATNEAAAAYTRAVKKAEADKQKSILHGEGISGQRNAIIHGFKESVEDMAEGLGLSYRDIMNFVVEMQRLDTYGTLGNSPNAKIVFMDPSKDKGSVTASNIVAHETAGS